MAHVRLRHRHRVQHRLVYVPVVLPKHAVNAMPTETPMTYIMTWMFRTGIAALAAFILLLSGSRLAANSEDFGASLEHASALCLGAASAGLLCAAVLWVVRRLNTVNKRQ